MLLAVSEAAVSQSSEVLDMALNVAATIFVAVIGPYLVQYLRRRQKLSETEMLKTHLEAKHMLAERVKNFVFGTAANIAERGIPKLAELVKTGKIKDSYTVKTVLHQWGKDLGKNTVDFFNEQGFDLVEEFGEKWVQNIIERAANEVNPYPGQPTSEALFRACCGGPGPCNTCPDNPNRSPA